LCLFSKIKKKREERGSKCPNSRITCKRKEKRERKRKLTLQTQAWFCGGGKKGVGNGLGVGGEEKGRENNSTGKKGGRKKQIEMKRCEVLLRHGKRSVFKAALNLGEERRGKVYSTHLRREEKERRKEIKKQ